MRIYFSSPLYFKFTYKFKMSPNCLFIHFSWFK